MTSLKIPNTRDDSRCVLVACCQLSEEPVVSFNLEETADIPFYVLKLIVVNDIPDQMICGNRELYCTVGAHVVRPAAELRTLTRVKAC